jgi:hypothetical protein
MASPIINAIQQKAQQSSAAQPQPSAARDDSQDQSAAPQQGADTQDNGNSSVLSDESAVEGESINLQRAYSKLNSAITALFDGLGVQRAATVAHVEGQSMSDHMQDVGKVLSTIGGVTANLLTATHTKHDPNGGATVAYPAHKLRETEVPADSDVARKAIDACRSFVSKCTALLGNDDPAVKTAKSQLDLVGRHDGEGMTSFDLGAALLSVPGPLIQKISRLHSEYKHGRVHPILTAPKA